jgi:hypothetical protein
VLLQLAAEGRVGLDTPVARYRPGLLPGGDAITVRMILEHTSGIYDYVNSVPSDGAPLVAARFRHYDARQLVESAAARPLLFPPAPLPRWPAPLAGLAAAPDAALVFRTGNFRPSGAGCPFARKPSTAWRFQARPVPTASGGGQAAGSAGSGGAVRQMT